MNHRFNFQKQHDQADCGPACLKMICGFYGKSVSLEYLRRECYLSRDGVSIVNLNHAAIKLGFNVFVGLLSLKDLEEKCPLPCVLHWNQNHFVVLLRIEAEPSGWRVKKKGKSGRRYVIADPAHGIVEVSEAEFKESWISGNESASGACLALEPGNDFFNSLNQDKKKPGYFIFRYLTPYKQYVWQIFLGMILASVISLAFPFLTRLLIDIGVGNKNINVIFAVLLSQIFLFIGATAINLIRSWLILHINARISLMIISDFLIKLLDLPMHFFDSKTVGDLTQRISDHHRIESFLTSSLVNFIFSAVNIVIFTAVLAFYNLLILGTFLFFSLVSVLWVVRFQRKRKDLDYQRFARNRENSNKLFELITGMHEVKLFGAEKEKRGGWERLQVKNFELNIESLALEQYQSTGFLFFNHLKNIFVSFIAAYEVVNGHITLGTLLSISYIIGQTNSPIEQLIGFITSAQDAKMSMERLQEINDQKGEDEQDTGSLMNEDIQLDDDIKLENVTFQYEGPDSSEVIKDLTIMIPKGKITAIVGSSGSGKTTLIKLLLKYYEPTQGSISLGPTDLRDIGPKSWRKNCGTVMQESFIFDDTIENNITLGAQEIDATRLDHALRTANLKEFVDALPLKHKTRIGASGIGLSGGEKQRLQIARAVYKNPQFIIFDEATSSLDANNEKIIIDNLSTFFKYKTVVIVAHRLSTVKNADQIILLEKGSIMETGNHKSLVAQQGNYFQLVKNQLEVSA